MFDCCVFVEDNVVGFFEFGNYRFGRVVGSFDDFDVFVNDDLGVGFVIWGDESR